MGKAFGAIVRFLLVLFIIGLVGYNTYEISELRAEIAQLRGKNGSGIAREQGSGTMEQVAEARSHAERASAFLKQKKLSEAAGEMQAASDAAARASSNAQAESRARVVAVQKSLAELSQQTSSLWKQAEGLAQKANATVASPTASDEKTNEKRSTKSE